MGSWASRAEQVLSGKGEAEHATRRLGAAWRAVGQASELVCGGLTIPLVGRLLEEYWGFGWTPVVIGDRADCLAAGDSTSYCARHLPKLARDYQWCQLGVLFDSVRVLSPVPGHVLFVDEVRAEAHWLPLAARSTREALAPTSKRVTSFADTVALRWHIATAERDRFVLYGHPRLEGHMVLHLQEEVLQTTGGSLTWQWRLAFVDEINSPYVSSSISCTFDPSDHTGRSLLVAVVAYQAWNITRSRLYRVFLNSALGPVLLCMWELCAIYSIQALRGTSHVVFVDDAGRLGSFDLRDMVSPPPDAAGNPGVFANAAGAVGYNKLSGRANDTRNRIVVDLREVSWANLSPDRFTHFRQVAFTVDANRHSVALLCRHSNACFSAPLPPELAPPRCDHRCECHKPIALVAPLPSAAPALLAPLRTQLPARPRALDAPRRL